MKQYKYFDWGIATNLETQYGLWSPVLDRFLLVVCDKDFGTTIKYLSSSRYSLFLFDLSTSDNYTTSLIDNSCCQHWTIANKTDIKLSKPQDYDVIPAQLVPSYSDPNWDVDAEQQWLQFILHYLKYIKLLYINNPWYKYSKFLNSINLAGSNLHETESFYNTVTTVEKHILKCLYLGNNIEETDKSIKEFLDQYPYLTKKKPPPPLKLI